MRSVTIVLGALLIGLAVPIAAFAGAHLPFKGADEGIWGLRTPLPAGPAGSRRQSSFGVGGIASALDFSDVQVLEGTISSVGSWK